MGFFARHEELVVLGTETDPFHAFALQGLAGAR
jgi:hypothetical protein